jgi:hypothetical protein
VLDNEVLRRIFDPKKDEMTGDWRKLHNEELHNLISSPTQPPIQWLPWDFSGGVKRQRREADHSPPTSAEVKKTWIFTSTPPYAFMAQCLIS